jgi:hypothetical protein
MTQNPTVNRYLKNKAMDHIDHALGRPIDPMQKSHRNYFAIGAKSDLAEQFSASPNWKKARQLDDMAYFMVTEAGRKALADHLKEIKDPHRAYQVTMNSAVGHLRGGLSMIVVAKSNGGAKYLAYLRASDCNDMKFRDFLKGVSARIAVVGGASA